MTPLEVILKECDGLSIDERAQLARKLLESIERDSEAEVVATGQRGLAAWTESARDESWSDFYPKTLSANGGSTG